MGRARHLFTLALTFCHLHAAGLSKRQSGQADAAALSSEQQMVVEACEHISDPSTTKVEQCHDHFRDAIKASEVEYCAETASLLVSCEQVSPENGSCIRQKAENASCTDTVHDTYLHCQEDGRVRPLTLILCANRRLNISDAPSLPTNITSVPLVVTTAIPFFTNGSIALWSTTATLFTTEALRTAPAATPPAFSQTGLWTNTTGSFPQTVPLASATGNIPVPISTGTGLSVPIPPAFTETGFWTDTVGSFPTSSLDTHTSLPTDASAISSLVEGTIPSNVPVGDPAPPPCPYETTQV